MMMNDLDPVDGACGIGMVAAVGAVGCGAAGTGCGLAWMQLEDMPRVAESIRLNSIFRMITLFG
jgi:hypothetical protein